MARQPNRRSPKGTLAADAPVRSWIAQIEAELRKAETATRGNWFQAAQIEILRTMLVIEREHGSELQNLTEGA